jgi:tetratricopeptide (TPR) repeat protein
MKSARRKEASALALFVDDSAPSDPRRWSAKSNLAHLTAWRLLAAAELDAVRTGVGSPIVTEETQKHNTRIYEATSHQPAAAVREAANRSWDILAAAVEACSKEDLEKPRLRRPDQPVWQVIPGNTYFHLAQHLEWWNTERAEAEAAEEAAKWAHDLAIRVFPTERSRGLADYNLGCFYAARGQAEKAIAYLRSAFALNPVMREWAKQDADLDPIRSVPELAHLLAKT